jgi:uncharacterized membrane protein YczE
MVSSTSASPALANLTPWAQVRAGRLPLRLLRLFTGRTLYGAAAACFVRAGVGLEPWGVFHYGLALHTGLSLGALVVLVGAVVLLLWIPLRQWPGLGAVAYALLIGPLTQFFMRWTVVELPVRPSVPVPA